MGSALVLEDIKVRFVTLLNRLGSFDHGSCFGDHVWCVIIHHFDKRISIGILSADFFGHSQGHFQFHGGHGAPGTFGSGPGCCRLAFHLVLYELHFIFLPPSVKNTALHAIDENIGNHIGIIINPGIPEYGIVHSSSLHIEVQRHSHGRVILKAQTNEGCDALKKLRRRWRKNWDRESGKNDRQGVGHFGAAHGARVVIEKPCIDARLVEDVFSVTSDVMNGRRGYAVQANRAVFAGTVEVAPRRTILGRGRQGTWRPALGQSLALGHFLCIFLVLVLVLVPVFVVEVLICLKTHMPLRLLFSLDNG